MVRTLQVDIAESVQVWLREARFQRQLLDAAVFDVMAPGHKLESRLRSLAAVVRVAAVSYVLRVGSAIEAER